MDTSAAGPLVTSPSTGPDVALPGVPSGPGWLALRDCPIGGHGSPVGLALLHPKIGVALVDFTPTPADAADRLRRALEARRFPAIFGGYPPIVRVVLPSDRLPDLGHVLAARFKAEPHLTLEGGDSWLPTARAALEAKPAATAPASPPSSAERREVSPWRAAVFILGAAASGAAAAAVALMPPPWRGSGSAPDPPPAVAVTAPEPADPPPPRSVPPRERVPAPEPVADTGIGADVAVSGEAASGSVPAPPVDEDRFELPSPPSSAPVAPTTVVGTAADQSWPVPPAAAVPDPAAAAEEPPTPARSADASLTPPRAAVAADRRAPPPTMATSAADAAGRKRCHDILVKTTLGVSLSDGDKDYMRRGCQQPRN